MSCMACIPIVPIARGRRRAMGSTSIDGDDDVVDEEDEGPSMMDGRGLGDDEDEARGRDGRHHRHRHRHHRGHHRGTLDVEAGRSRGAVRAEAGTDDVSVAERLCATQLGVSYDKRDRSWTEHGEACLLATGQLYPACAVAMGMRTANISLCGYMELVPNVVGATYFVGVAGTVASCVWGTLRATRAEPNRALKAARFAAGMTPAVTLAGTFVFGQGGDAFEGNRFKTNPAREQIKENKTEEEGKGKKEKREWHAAAPLNPLHLVFIYKYLPVSTRVGSCTPYSYP